MIGLSEVMYGGIVPGIVAAVTLVIVWRATGKAASAWRTALVLGYVAGHWALNAQTTSFAVALAKSLRPIEPRDWLPLFALLAMVPDALACVGKLGSAVGWLLRVAFCVWVPWRLLYGSVYLPLQLEGLDVDFGGWSPGEAAAWIGGIAAALLFAWILSRIVDQQQDQQQDVHVQSMLAAVVALGAAITMAMAESLVYGQLFGVLAAALAGCGIASASMSTGRGPDAAAGPIVIAFGCLLVVGYFYAELKLHNGALLMVAMVLAIGWLPRLPKLLPNWQLLGRSVLCLATLGIAVALAGRDLASSLSSNDSNPYQSSKVESLF